MACWTHYCPTSSCHPQLFGPGSNCNSRGVQPVRLTWRPTAPQALVAASSRTKRRGRFSSQCAFGSDSSTPRHNFSRPRPRLRRRRNPQCHPRHHAAAPTAKPRTRMMEVHGRGAGGTAVAGGRAARSLGFRRPPRALAARRAPAVQPMAQPRPRRRPHATARTSARSGSCRSSSGGGRRGNVAPHAHTRSGKAWRTAIRRMTARRRTE